MLLRKERTKNDRLVRKGHFLEKDDRQDQRMGEGGGGKGQAAVAGGHINMKERVVTSSGSRVHIVVSSS